MQLAQLNIADAKFDNEDARMSGFVGAIDAINAMADRAPGFVWRLIDDEAGVDGAINVKLPGVEGVLVNMSVWDDVESLYGFVYKTAHAKVMTKKAAWFDPMSSNHMVLWWVDDGHQPTVSEAQAKLARLDEIGPGPEAFSFAVPFNAAGKPISLTLPKKDCA